jgi:hypothetical protein
MTNKTLSTQALSVIDQYLHFKVGPAECSIPYFNNKTVRARAALSVRVGKGNPKEILDEATALLFKNHVDMATLSGESLKKLLVDNGIGIDCSGFAYHILNAESTERGKGPLKKYFHFIRTSGLIGKIFVSLRPVKNTDVATFANDENSRAISLMDIQPGDIVTMLSGTDGGERDHILVVSAVESEDNMPKKISYSHAVAYPEDGVYGSGVRQGEIEILNANGTITDQIWKESGTVEAAARIFARAKVSKTELRRLKWL